MTEWVVAGFILGGLAATGLNALLTERVVPLLIRHGWR